MHNCVGLPKMVVIGIERGSARTFTSEGGGEMKVK